MYADENLVYFNEDSGNVVFSCNEIRILNADLTNNNLDNNFDEDDPDTIIHIRLLTWHFKFEKRKALNSQPTFQRRLNVVSTLWINVEITLIRRCK